MGEKGSRGLSKSKKVWSGVGQNIARLEAAIEKKKGYEARLDEEDV